VRANKNALGRELDADDDDEQVWERLRSGAAQPSRERATSDVVPRARSAGDVDPYSSYAQYVQKSDEAEDDGQEDEAVWERLRAQQLTDSGARARMRAPEQRFSDVAPIGSHAAWEAGQAEAYYQQQEQQEYEQQAYEQQQQQAYYYQQHQEAQQALSYDQQQAQYYAQQQEAQYYAQQQQAYEQQQAAAYTQQQQADYHAQQTYEQQHADYRAQQQAYEQQQAYAQQQAIRQQQPYAAPEVQPSRDGDDGYAPKRSGKGGLFLAFAALLVAGAGGAVAYQRGMLTPSPTPIVIGSGTPSVPASAIPLGAEEARARDQLLGTHTSPAATTAPSVEAVPAQPEASAETPEPVAPAVVAPPAETKQVATRSESKKSKAKKAKAKKARRHAAAPRRAAKKARAERPRLSSVSNRSNDPLEGI